MEALFAHVIFALVCTVFAFGLCVFLSEYDRRTVAFNKRAWALGWYKPDPALAQSYPEEGVVVGPSPHRKDRRLHSNRSVLILLVVVIALHLTVMLINSDLRLWLVGGVAAGAILAELYTAWVGVGLFRLTDTALHHERPFRAAVLYPLADLKRVAPALGGFDYGVTLEFSGSQRARMTARMWGHGAMMTRLARHDHDVAEHMEQVAALKAALNRKGHHA